MTLRQQAEQFAAMYRIHNDDDEPQMMAEFAAKVRDAAVAAQKERLDGTQEAK